jgi:hypothetical protein
MNDDQHHSWESATEHPLHRVQYALSSANRIHGRDHISQPSKALQLLAGVAFAGSFTHPLPSATAVQPHPLSPPMA